MTEAKDAVRRRMPPEVRHRQVLEAAVAAFAEGGYAGTTTDQVARLAGVSQPYVVRLFGGKKELFLAAHTHVLDRVEQAFRTAVEHRPPGMEPLQALTHAYLALIPDRDLLKVMQHGFVAGGSPVFGPAVRACLTRMYALVRELAGVSPAEARDFVASGLLINTMVSVDLLDHAGEDADAQELLHSTLGGTDIADFLAAGDKA
ncbi:TetR/AcrR family transcriptional regulator [Actinosynnema sp. CA-248983]